MPFAMVIRPMPYYIFAFALLLLFAYVVGGSPSPAAPRLGANRASPGPTSRTCSGTRFLPALSILILGTAVWFQTMKLVVQNVNGESFVQYAKLGGVKKSRIVSRYVIRNALLPADHGAGPVAGPDF